MITVHVYFVAIPAIPNTKNYCLVNTPLILTWKAAPSIDHRLTVPVVADVSVHEAGVGSFGGPHAEVADARAGA